ncbi:helix-turn-helix domain-containing protein [Sedimentitalea arenosa]|uniref:Helix-turn-helix transcriptional regulator n=1 Tax=Sedimentitalea arenosa TaxID=2798803 RepID=A0A8J7JAJ8_9RHOB|nr:helix-turn-helix transcriptional regulator [Arenibacterium arenosum]MBJ6372278.1 helix-turn-helix transcriptional regulator [Arenibacterium arenosum]
MKKEEKETLAMTRDTGREASAIRLVAARKAIGMTQSELGELVGIKKAAISNAESGRSFPSRSVLVYLHRNHRIDFNFMMAGELSQLPQDVQQMLLDCLLEIGSHSD